MSEGSGTKLDYVVGFFTPHPQERLASSSKSGFGEIVTLLILVNLDPWIYTVPNTLSTKMESMHKTLVLNTEVLAYLKEKD